MFRRRCSEGGGLVLTVGEFLELILRGRFCDVFVVDDKHDNVTGLIFDGRHEDAAQEPGTWKKQGQRFNSATKGLFSGYATGFMTGDTVRPIRQRPTWNPTDLRVV